ncbi:MAG: hypothetical protein JO301_09615 [Chitinophagaceae bacterium]|nr:hypothetical protein [Chitinophagaceae bacterium]
MEDYRTYELTELVDLLAKRTATYTQLMADGYSDGEEFAQIEKDILGLQKEILRKMGIDDPPDKLSTDKL